MAWRISCKIPNSENKVHYEINKGAFSSTVFKTYFISPRNFDKYSAAKICRRYFEVRRQFGSNFFVTINWHFDREQNYFIFSILLILLIKSVWYSRKPCFTLLVLTLLHYGRCSKIVCMFELEVTWSISELSMYFKISHKNKSVYKRIAHFLELFSNYNRIEKAVKHHQWHKNSTAAKKLPPII
jgi:hypothetical protein